MVSVVLVIVVFVTLVTASIPMAKAGPPSEIGVRLDGRYLDFDVPPMIVSGRTMVPFRVIFEELVLEVNWNELTRTVSGTRQGLTIEVPIDSQTAYINGQTVGLEVPAMTHNGRTLVPLRFVAEASGAEVEWNSTKRVAIILTECIASEFELAVLELVNAERANNGLESVRWNCWLSDAARAHSIDMVRRGFHDHPCPDGYRHCDRISGSWRIAAENIARGFRTPEEVVEAWMNSEKGHRENILNPELTHMGVGFYEYNWTQKFSG